MLPIWFFSSVGYMKELRFKMSLVLIGAQKVPCLATVPDAPRFKQQSKSWKNTPPHGCRYRQKTTPIIDRRGRTCELLLPTTNYPTIIVDIYWRHLFSNNTSHPLQDSCTLRPKSPEWYFRQCTKYVIYLGAQFQHLLRATNSLSQVCSSWRGSESLFGAINMAVGLTLKLWWRAEGNIIIKVKMQDLSPSTRVNFRLIDHVLKNHEEM